jgi:hypothetical protein
MNSATRLAVPIFDRMTFLGFIIDRLLGRLALAVCSLRHIPKIKTNNVLAREWPTFKTATVTLRALRPSLEAPVHRELSPPRKQPEGEPRLNWIYSAIKNLEVR